MFSESLHALRPDTLQTEDGDTVPQSRWPVQKTVPVVVEDLDRNPSDLKFPENLEQEVEYNDSTDTYVIGTKLGGVYLGAPIFMTPEEYRQWSLKKAFDTFFRSKAETERENAGKEKFDFTDMHFNLGPAEKIFGPGGVRIKTQGTAEIRFGGTHKNIDNPSIPIRNRKTMDINFEEKVNLNMTGKVGDKMNMNFNYNTDATFDFDSKNIKLKYEGKEDEIIKLIEAGNVSFPSNSALITGATSLFGVRTDMQFGKLKLQTVLSQKNSNSKSVSSKGGTQTTSFELDVANYEENRHFFLADYFRQNYDVWMGQLPNLTSGITLNRVEIWVTNKTGNTNNCRNIIALSKLGDEMEGLIPSNPNSYIYNKVVALPGVRDADQATNALEGAGLKGGVDYEKLESARLLTSSEYTINTAMGYVSLRTALQTDQVLAIAFEFTAGGQTFQVGEFASDNTNAQEAIIVKALKNTSCNPQQPNWPLMMKNVYYLASNVEKTKFRLDIKYQSDSTGVYVTHIPEPQTKDDILIRAIGADRLDNNNKLHPNGYFDFVEGYTVSNGRVFLPKAEPFGKAIYDYMIGKGVSADKAGKYAFTELYTETRTTAKLMAEKNKFIITGQYKGTSANVISLGAYNVPQGSVVVTAGGMTLNEGSDYSVDYSAGEVTILNQSILDSGTNVNVSLESNTDYAQTRKTMVGVNWEYDFSKKLQLSGTFQHLSEQALTTKVSMGSEPLNNTLWGLNVNWKTESQWLTNMLSKLPGLHCTEPSRISFTGEFAQLIAGQASNTQDHASYVDDFENTKNGIDIMSPSSWVMSSIPSERFKDDYNKRPELSAGFNRALLSWYVIDPLFTRQSSSYTPSHFKGDANQLSNHYVREVPVRELFPARDINNYSGSTTTLSVLNLAYYPQERGAYNFSNNLDENGKLASQPAHHWGGMMRKLDTNDFEAANVEYLEFWMLDPFIYINRDKDVDPSLYEGKLYIDLGEVSEDILPDGKKFYESGMPVDGTQRWQDTKWGRIPTQTTTTYAFATTTGSRALQDLGFNGLNDREELNFEYYKDFIDNAKDVVKNPDALNAIIDDPANDNYHYFRGTDFDEAQTSILDRYKRINMPQGNSPDSDQRTESYDTSYKAGPDIEDINQDYTLNEYEKYFEYEVDLNRYMNDPHIVDKRRTNVTLRNGTTDEVTWYQFRIPLSEETRQRVGSIADLSSVRYIRMYLTGFQRPIVLRFGTLDLVRGEWRTYNQQVANTATRTLGTLAVSAVNIEENNEKEPVNYILPPGITRESDPTQPQLAEQNEQALAMKVDGLGGGEARGIYKGTTLDMRQYKRLQMFVHANALEQNITNTQSGETSLIIRVGSDYRSNYYEYEIPLELTPPGRYDRYSPIDCHTVWPQENMLDIDLGLFTAIKKARNKARSSGITSNNTPYSEYDEANPKNKITIVGNPTLGEVKAIFVGIKNNAISPRSVEVWINELRLREYNNSGGWAAQGTLNVQLSDVAQVNLAGRYVSEGFGGLESGVMERTKDTQKSYNITANVELGKFLPDKAKVNAPLYYNVSKEISTPKYNPLDTDMEMDDALEGMTKHEADSVKSIAVTETVSKNLALSNWRVGISTKGHPMPYDPSNFTFSFSKSHRNTSGETTVYEKEDTWKGLFSYSYSPVYKTFSPFKNIKSKSKWYTILKDFGLNYLPQSIAFNSEIARSYYELQERDVEDISGSKLPLTFNSQFLFNRDFNIRWDLTKNLHFTFQSATHAEVEEPYSPVNKDLYPEQYEAWKDSVWTSIRHWGRPLDYSQSVQASYQLPLNKIPIFNWITGNASYNATYNWQRGTEREDGSSLGNNISNRRDLNINGTFNMESLYNQIPFLAAVNKKYNTKTTTVRKDSGTKTPNRNSKTGKTGKDAKEKEKEEKQLPKNKNTYTKEIKLFPDSTISIAHGRNSKRLIVNATTKDGKPYRINYKVKDNNNILITGADTATVKLTVTTRQRPDDKAWYKTLQAGARFLMMIRNINISYRNQYSMSLPGFMPNAGDMFGQNKTGGLMAPGLDFAFGMVGEDYLDKAMDRGWMLCNDSIATPARTSSTTDLQIKMTVEPVRNLKIDLSASRQQTKAKSIQYMFEGSPTTHSGTFSITTISLGSALESTGDANNGYHSKIFEKFCNSLADYRQRVEDRYIGTRYTVGPMAGKEFDPKLTPVDPYSADVMIPAFLNTYTMSGGGSLDLFPSLARLLPNWTLKYSGLKDLPWFSEHFKSFNINHGYKSVFAIGSYSSYSAWQEFMDGLGFAQAADGSATPSSIFNISTVSINEAFSPLLGVDFTLHNNMTFKVEYKTTRVMSLSMTSVQLSENSSKDWVIGMGYKINDFKLFGRGKNRKVKGNNKKNGEQEENAQQNNNRRNQNNNRNSFNSDLNLKLDISYRNQAALTRDIASMQSAASSGNTAWKVSFSADYAMSRLITMSFYYDMQKNIPLLSASSYPTTTQDFGLSMKFSLTR